MKATLQPDGTLKEMPDMEKPKLKDEVPYDYYQGWDLRQYNADMYEYNTALSKCRTLEVEGWTPEPGKKYQEGIHYEVKMIRIYESKIWEPDLGCDECCNGDRCDDPTHYSRNKCPYCKGTGRIKNPFFAVPILKKPSPVAVPISDNQDDLWKEVFDTLLNSGDMYSYNYAGAMENLKQRGFTITRKQ